MRDNERRCHRVTTKFIVGDTKNCVLCACQFHLHQGSEKAISFPDSLNTLKKTSVQNDRSRLAQLSATSRRRRNNMSDRKPPAVLVVRVHFTNSGCRKTTGRIFSGMFVFDLVCNTRSYCLLEQHEPTGFAEQPSKESVVDKCKFVQSSTVGQPDKELGPFGSGCKSFSLL